MSTGEPLPLHRHPRPHAELWRRYRHYAAQQEFRVSVLLGALLLAASLFVKWGDAKASDFLQRLKDNEAVIAAGNSDVKDRVADGRVAVGLLDEDDAVVARKLPRGQPPDEGPSGPDLDGGYLVSAGSLRTLC